MPQLQLFKLLRGKLPGVWVGMMHVLWWSSRCMAGEVPTNYAVQGWNAENGLPQNSVAAICQTRDGYLWLGTYSGLVRFDGVRFVVFDTENTPALETVRITSLYEDKQGALWIGHESGELTRYRDGQFEVVTVPKTWSGATIADMFTDASGYLWLASREGLLMRLNDGFLIPSPVKGDDRSITEFKEERSGRVWVLRNGRLGWLDNGEVKPWLLPGGIAPPFRVQAVTPSRQGGVWIVYGGQARRWVETNWVSRGDAYAWETGAGGYITRMIELRSGSLAIASTGRGIHIMQPGAVPLKFDHTNKLDNDWVRSLCEDREGNLWAGVGNSGLAVLRPANFITYLPPDKMNGYSVTAVSPRQEGGLWVGSEGAGLYGYDGETWTNYGEIQGLTNRFIWSVAQEAGGKVWVGTWGAGLFVGEEDHFRTAPGLEGNTMPVLAILSITNGEFWVGTRNGLLHYAQGRTNWYDAKTGLVSPDIRCVAQGADGAIWFGMMGGGLGWFKDGNIRQFRKQDGLASDSVLCLRYETNGALWIGTFGGGLNRLKDGRFSRIGVRNGLPNNSISHIEEDDTGNFWLASESGIFRVDKAELNHFADNPAGTIYCTVFGKNDGMDSVQCASGFQPAGCRTADGRLWFPTHKGVVGVNPARQRINYSQPPVIIEGLFSDGLGKLNLIHRPGISAKQPINIQPGRRRFEFHYTALSFTDPQKVRFKYRLEGLESDWTEAMDKRSATYSYLPPGKYTFRVIACNNNGIWNEVGDSQAIVILPYFWQRASFQAAASLLAVALIAATVRYALRRRYRRKLAELERERALERERSRIAKDIHDDLGSSLTRITMLSESARRQSARPEATADYLNTIYKTSRELTRSMDEIVWAVNPKHDTLNSLAAYLLRYAQEFLSPAGIRCRSDIPLGLPVIPITSEIRHNLFLAYKEALHNVVKHARATEVNISLLLSESGIEITVADNGIGFAPDRIPGENAPEGGGRLTSGDGLENMKKRLAQIHGECRVESSPGQGTRVSYRIPLAEKSQ
jgi:signal transduction histidine kinase/ligand-binding sensor domain-containing protein